MSEIDRLRWQCRRGSLELDILLSNYLQQCYASACAEQQAAFQQLLDYQDQHIIQYLTGQITAPADSPLNQLVSHIQTLNQRPA